MMKISSALFFSYPNGILYQNAIMRWMERYFHTLWFTCIFPWMIVIKLDMTCYLCHLILERLRIAGKCMLQNWYLKALNAFWTKETSFEIKCTWLMLLTSKALTKLVNGRYRCPSRLTSTYFMSFKGCIHRLFLNFSINNETDLTYNYSLSYLQWKEHAFIFFNFSI